MSADDDRRRQALLDELRRLHRAEPEPAGLRERWLQRAERGPHALLPLLRLRRGMFERPGSGLDRLAAVVPKSARVSPAAFGLVLLAGLVLGAGVRGLWPGAPDDRASLAADAPYALGPEPRPASPSAARRSLESEPSAAATPPLVRARCPLDELPRGAIIAPEQLVTPGLAVRTFEQQTPSCGRLTRRYLEPLPLAAPARTRAPVLILLHDAGESAELSRARRDGPALERAAREQGIVLVYANAAPGRGTDVAVANSGAWQTDARTALEVDDDDYLAAIVGDLTLRHVIEGSNDVFLVGYGDGARTALAAAEGGDYAGVAAIEPTPGARLEPGRPRIGGRLSRVLLALGPGASPPGGAPELASCWASALGVEPELSRSRYSLADGEAPRGSVEQLDIAAPATGSSAVRLLVLPGRADRAPTPRHAWDFLRGADGLDGPPPDPLEPGPAGDDPARSAHVDGFEPPPLVLDEDTVLAPSSAGTR